MSNPIQPGAKLLKISTVLEFILLAGTAVVTLLWFAGMPLLYYENEPVMSVFTSISLMLMIGSRLAQRLLFGWPTPLTLALVGLVLGGNLSSILMHTSMPPELMQSFDIVLTSVMTSTGLILFCLYELLVALRESPKSAFIVDDILLHLALVPGGLSLLGYLLNNPLYLSEGSDPRVGISPLEMGFMALYALTAVISNRNLFLWQFLSESWNNRITFAALFTNQFIAPVIVAYAFLGVASAPKTPGLELFVMLAGVIATVSFLVLQAYLKRRPAAE